MRPASPEHLLQVGMGFWASKTLLSAVELGLFSVLAEAPADLSQLRARLGLHERSARDFFDALVALKVLEREDGVYRNTADADCFLDKAKPSYIGGLLEMANARLYGFWGSLTEALRTGEIQNEGKHAEDFFGAMYADPARLRQFLGAMSGISAGAAQAIAAKFDWSPYKTFMDLGAAQGRVPVTLAEAHPHLSGIGFDLPQVQPVFEEFAARARPLGPAAFPARQLLRGPSAHGRRNRDGSYPARLGPDPEESLAAQGLRLLTNPWREPGVFDSVVHVEETDSATDGF